MILRWLDATTLAVEADGLTPETFRPLSAPEAERLPIRIGNRGGLIGDVFAVETSGDDVLSFEGDLSHVRGIGRKMDSGRLVVRGTAGPHLGAGMTGGEIDVRGDAGDWAGAGMAGGLLRVRGRAGRSLGGAYPGSRLGMRDGVILVDGSAGDEAGARMRRGLIAVAGAAGEGFGRGLVAGSLFAFGPVGRFPGSGMKRGTIGLFGPRPAELLPSFAFAGAYRFPFLTIYLRRLAAWGFLVPDDAFGAAAGRYNGDLADGGLGEILVVGGAVGR